MDTPKGWKKTKLGEIADILGGYAFKSSKMLSEKAQYQLLKIANLYKGNLDMTRKPSYWDISAKNEHNYILNRGDVVLTLTGTNGKRDYGYSVLINENNSYLLNQRVARLRANSSCYAFLFYWTQTNLFLNPFFNAAIGGTGNQANVSVVALGSIPISLPPLEEQRAIADLLGCWDEAIETTQKLIAAKEKQFKALLQKLIADQCPTNNKSSNWKMIKLGEVCNPITRKNTIGNKNVLTSSAAYGLINQREYYNRSVAASNLDGYYLLHNGDFAYNRSSANGYPFGATKRLDRYSDGVLSTLYLCFSIKDETKCWSDYLLHFFESGSANRELRAVCQAGARSHGLLNITKADFYSIKIPLPPLDEQKRIAGVLDTAQREIDLLKKLLEKYREQKRGLMQKLLTGIWRIKPAVVAEFKGI